MSCSHGSTRYSVLQYECLFYSSPTTVLALQCCCLITLHCSTLTRVRQYVYPYYLTRAAAYCNTDTSVARAAWQPGALG